MGSPCFSPWPWWGFPAHRKYNRAGHLALLVFWCVSCVCPLVRSSVFPCVLTFCVLVVLSPRCSFGCFSLGGFYVVLFLRFWSLDDTVMGGISQGVLFSATYLLVESWVSYIEFGNMAGKHVIGGVEFRYVSQPARRFWYSISGEVQFRRGREFVGAVYL